MAFEKPSHSETDIPADSEASTKKKKSNKSKEQARTEKVPLKVPLAIEEQTVTRTEESKPEPESEQQKKKRSRKKSKKTKSAPEVSGQTKEASAAEVPEQTTRGEESKKPEKQSKKPENNVGEEAENPDIEQDEIVTHEADEADTAEEIVLSQEAVGEEGDLFVSERLRSATQTPEDAQAKTGESDDEAAGEDTSPRATTGGSTTPRTRRSSGATTTGSTTGGAAVGTGSSSTASSSRTRASGGGGAPPVIPGNPVAGAGGYNTPPVAPVPRTAEAVPTASPERTSNRRSAERRSLAAGVIIGGVIEHIRHKRREKRMEKAHAKELKDTQKDHNAEKMRNEQQAKRQKTTLEQRIERLKQEVTAKPKQQESKSQAGKAPTLEQHLKSAYMPRDIAQEKSRPVNSTSQESTPRPKSVTTELQKPNPTKPAEALSVIPGESEQADVPPDRRVESSAWHRIEIDKKTGKAVEDPSIAYGHEFQNEQHQEQLRKKIADASMEAEKVREAYMPKPPKTGATNGASANPLHQSQPANPLQPTPSASKTEAPSLANVIQKTKDTTAGKDPVDIVLWIVLIIVLGVIVIIL